MKIDLKYFDFTGRGEVLRILLHGCNDVEFSETRIPFSEWGLLKPTFPLGQIPVLSIDGTVMTQSTSLYRYCATLVHLYPSDPLTALVVDETMDILNDLIAQIPKQAGTDEEFKIQRHEHRDTVMMQAFTLIESRIAQFGAGTNTICGVPSVADLSIMNYTNILECKALTHLDGTILNDFPNIVNVANSMMKHPIVVSYNTKCKE